MASYPLLERGARFGRPGQVTQSYLAGLFQLTFYVPEGAGGRFGLRGGQGKFLAPISRVGRGSRASRMFSAQNRLEESVQLAQKQGKLL